MLTFLPVLFFAVSFEVTASFVMGIVGRFEESVTGDKKAEFASALFDALIICTCIALQKAALLYFKGRCALRWRDYLVRKQHEVYFHPDVFARIHSHHQQQQQQQQQLPSRRSSGVLALPASSPTSDQVLDNPDQRLSQDTDRLTMNLAELVACGVTLPGKVVYYSMALSSLFGWFAPACCVVFFVLGTIPNLLLLHRVVPQLVQQEKCEGDFRHCHSGIRTFSESISFSRGTQMDRSRANDSLSRLVSNQHRVLCRQLPLNIVIQLCDYMGAVANYGILGLGILYLATAEGKTPSQIAGLLASGSYACMYLINTFTSMFDLSNYFADVVAYGRRVEEMFEYGEKYGGGGRGRGGGGGSDAMGGGERPNDGNVLLSAVDVTLRSPPSTSDVKGKLLVRHLDFHILAGETIMVRGESGVGKSTLLRAIARVGDVNVTGLRLHIPLSDVTFVPQSPFMFTGTLEALLCYPRSNEIVFDDDRRKLKKYVMAMDLSGIIKVAGGWNETFDWTTLSPGEQQRVALIRLLMCPPKLAIMDEAFTALDSDMVERCLVLLRKMVEVEGEETTFVFVSHSSRLEEHCDRTVVLERYGAGRELLPQ